MAVELGFWTLNLLRASTRHYVLQCTESVLENGTADASLSNAAPSEFKDVRRMHAESCMLENPEELRQPDAALPSPGVRQG